MIVLKFSSDSVDFIFLGSSFQIFGPSILRLFIRKLCDLLVASLNCLDVVKKSCNWILRKCFAYN